MKDYPYQDLMAAARILADAQMAVGAADGPLVVSPAWNIVFQAKLKVLERADAVLRGAVESVEVL